MIWNYLKNIWALIDWYMAFINNDMSTQLDGVQKLLFQGKSVENS